MLHWVFGDWLPQAPRERILIGSSIGAWRMAHGGSMSARPGRCLRPPG